MIHMDSVRRLNIIGIAAIATIIFSASGAAGYGLHRALAAGYEADTRMAEIALAAQATVVREQTSAGRPVHIDMPSIGVDADLEYVGLKADGTIGSPKGPVNAAWFYPGAIPGADGTAVIDGHYGWKDGIRAVFDDLHRTQTGDLIQVIDQKGIISTFVVRQVVTYGQNDDAADVFNAKGPGSHLNLITCGGAWNHVSQHYAERTVVFSDELSYAPPGGRASGL